MFNYTEKMENEAVELRKKYLSVIDVPLAKRELDQMLDNGFMGQVIAGDNVLCISDGEEIPQYLKQWLNDLLLSFDIDFLDDEPDGRYLLLLSLSMSIIGTDALVNSFTEYKAEYLCRALLTNIVGEFFLEYTDNVDRMIPYMQALGISFFFNGTTITCNRYRDVADFAINTMQTEKQMDNVLDV